MAKIQKRNLDSARRAPLRHSAYEAPEINTKRSKVIPREYQTFDKAPRSRGGFLFFLFLLFVVTLGGFVYWNQKSQQKSPVSLEFSVSGPDKVVSGDQVTYLIKYKNVDVVPLQQMELSVYWPKGFYFDEANLAPSDENATTWFFEDLASGAEGTLEIKGQLVGQKDEEVTSFFSLSYQPENFHSDFKAKENILTKISDNKIELALEGADKTLVATPEEFKITFRNLTEEKIEALYVDILYPEDFIEAKAETAEEVIDKEVVEGETQAPTGDFVLENDYLRFDLEAKEEKTKLIKGEFSVDSKSEQTLIIEVGNLVDGKFRRLARLEKKIQVINPKFDIKLEINGQSEIQKINWGDTLRYQLEIINQSGADISGANVRALLDAEALDWDSLDTVAKKEENNIIWSPTEIEDLAIWPAGASRIFTWQIKAVNEPIAQRTIENIIKINIEGLAGWEQISPSVLITVGESLSFKNGIYWDLGGRRVGSGLLPPKVGEATQYLVVWSLPEATGNFDSVTVTSSLSPETNFISETDIQEGDFTFDEVSKTLTWELGNFNDLLLPVTASFIIEVIPEKESKDQAVTLLNSTTVNANGKEEVIINSKLLKTSDVVANTSEPIGIVQ